ncbi:MAG: hypothetical protein Q7R70_04055 [Candidatus Diapherotrites archaeon]|nr:hypothetical protein [Candidatus Diapherotrites archaeon]
MIEAELNAMAYGFEIKVLINGKYIGIKGEKSESKRLMSTDHELAGMLSSELKNLACLKPGKNTISINYSKLKEADKNAKVTIEIRTEEQFKQGKFAFKFENKGKPSGQIESVFEI